MEVYIEDVILDNFIIDFIILWTTAKLLHLKPNYIFIILASAFGVGLTFVNFFISLTGFFLFAFKLLIGLSMVAIAFREKFFKKIFLQYLTFLFITFIYGGACFLICFSFGNIIIATNGVVSYELALPLGIIAGIIFAISLFLFQVFQKIKDKAKVENFVYDAMICNNNCQIHLKAFLDTGNTLIDPITNKPVVFISYDNFKRLFKTVPLHEILLRKPIKQLKNMHYIPALSVGQKSDILIFTIENFSVSQNKFKYHFKNAVLGLTFANLDKQLDCGLLLNSKLLNGDYYE